MSAGKLRRRRSSVEEDKTYSVSVNMLCIIGATIGIFSLFLPWRWMGEGLILSSSSVYDALLTPRDYPFLWVEHLISISQVLFISGTILAFAIPAACSIQAVGLIFFYVEVIDTDLPYAYDQGLSVGFFIAVLSFAVVVAGLIVPYGFGSDASQNWWLRRIHTASRIRLSHDRGPAQSFASPLDFVRGIWRHKRWGAALLTVIILLSVLLYVDEADKEGAGYVEYVDGRIVVAIGDSAIYGHWAEWILLVSDESETAEWELEANLELLYDQGVWIPPTLEARNISEMTLVPAILDYGGDGHITHADQIILTPQSGTSFSDDTEYRVALLQALRWYDVPLTHLYVSFELDNDGIDYEFEIVRTQGLGVPTNHTVWPTYISVTVLVVSSVAVYSAMIWTLQSKGRGCQRYSSR